MSKAAPSPLVTVDEATQVVSEYARGFEREVAAELSRLAVIAMSLARWQPQGAK